MLEPGVYQLPAPIVVSSGHMTLSRALRSDRLTSSSPHSSTAGGDSGGSRGISSSNSSSSQSAEVAVDATADEEAVVLQCMGGLGRDTGALTASSALVVHVIAGAETTAAGAEATTERAGDVVDVSGSGNVTAPAPGLVNGEASSMPVGEVQAVSGGSFSMVGITVQGCTTTAVIINVQITLQDDENVNAASNVSTLAPGALINVTNCIFSSNSGSPAGALHVSGTGVPLSAGSASTTNTSASTRSISGVQVNVQNTVFANNINPSGAAAALLLQGQLGTPMRAMITATNFTHNNGYLTPGHVTASSPSECPGGGAVCAVALSEFILVSSQLHGNSQEGGLGGAIALVDTATVMVWAAWHCW